MDKKTETKLLVDIAGGDKETLPFLLEWLNNGRNATQAYLKTHPMVSYSSARVLGSRQLAKVNTFGLSYAYGLGIESYMKQLKEGLEAADMEGNPDHKTRFPYFSVLGELLGFTA